jgi:hypothetical protein
MEPRFIGKDPDSPQGGSPSLWDDGDSYVIPNVNGQVKVPGGGQLKVPTPRG